VLRADIHIGMWKNLTEGGPLKKVKEKDGKGQEGFGELDRRRSSHAPKSIQSPPQEKRNGGDFRRGREEIGNAQMVFWILTGDMNKPSERRAPKGRRTRKSLEEVRSFKKRYSKCQGKLCSKRDAS